MSYNNTALKSSNITEMVVDIVGAYTSNNKVGADQLPGLIQSVYSALSMAEAPAAPVQEPTAKATPYQVKKSITPDAIISFIDNKPYKTLKRHLSTHGLTVDEYKAKFGLPRDYPTTAPSYSAHRSSMAKTMGLGAGKRTRARKERGG